MDFICVISFYYNCFKAICEERNNTNASLSNIIPDNVRTFFKDRSSYINQQLDQENYDQLYQNGDKSLFETFVNELPNKYDDTLQSLVDDYYNGGVAQTGKPIDMILRARIVSTLDGCTKEEAQSILDNKKQNTQPYDTLVLEEPIDFSAFTALKNEQTTENEPSIRNDHQKHQKHLDNKEHQEQEFPQPIDYFEGIDYPENDFPYEFDPTQFEPPTLDQMTL